MEEFETDLDNLELAIRRLVQTIKRPQQWARITERAGISIDRPSATILHILMLPRNEGWRIHDLAVQLGIEAPSVTRKSQELESAGYVRRVRNPRDRRAIGLQLTARGRSINNKLQKAQRASFQEALSSWSKSDRQQFIELFTRFATDLSTQPKTT